MSLIHPYQQVMSLPDGADVRSCFTNMRSCFTTGKWTSSPASQQQLTSHVVNVRSNQQVVSLPHGADVRSCLTNMRSCFTNMRSCFTNTYFAEMCGG